MWGEPGVRAAVVAAVAATALSGPGGLGAWRVPWTSAYSATARPSADRIRRHARPWLLNQSSIWASTASRSSCTARLGMRPLARMWQMLLKALEEVAVAPNPMMAAEMAIIRLTHVADLPDPETLVRKLSDSPRPPSGGGIPGGAPAGGGAVHSARLAPVQMPASPTRGPTMTATAPAFAEGQLQVYATFDQVVDLIRQKRDMLLLSEVETVPECSWYSVISWP